MDIGKSLHPHHQTYFIISFTTITCPVLLVSSIIKLFSFRLMCEDGVKQSKLVNYLMTN